MSGQVIPFRDQPRRTRPAANMAECLASMRADVERARARAPRKKIAGPADPVLTPLEWDRREKWVTGAGAPPLPQAEPPEPPADEPGDDAEVPF